MSDTATCTNAELAGKVVALEVNIAAFKELMKERGEVTSIKHESVLRVITEMDRRIEVQFSEKDKAVSAALAAAKEAVAAALSAADRAVAKAEIATENRFESVNEFRAQLGDQTRTLMSRTEFEAKYDSLDQKVGALEKAIERAGGRGAGIASIIGGAFAAGLVIVGVLDLTLRSH